MTRTCRCGNEFTVPDGRGHTRRIFCSRRCGRAVWNRCRRNRCRRWANRPDGLCHVHHRLEIEDQKAWTVRDEVLDFLELEGWATALEVADRFGRHVQTVERQLRQLRREGVVESRIVELAHSGRGNGYDKRTEWRMS